MEYKKPTESYTVIAVDLKEPIMMRLELFLDREKMRDFLLEYANEHKRCIIIPGPVDDMDYQVEYESDQKTIKALHFEDESGYKIPFSLITTREMMAKEDAEFMDSINNIVSNSGDNDD